MSVMHYSKYGLNTCQSTPYFRACIPPNYPLDETLQNCRRFLKLPTRLRKLSKLARTWTEKNIPGKVAGIEAWYDDTGHELDPKTGERLTDAQVNEQWDALDVPKIDVEDIPEPEGGFPDPETWEPTAPTPEPPERYVPPRDQLLRDIASHGPEAVAREYGIPVDQLPTTATLSLDAVPDLKAGDMPKAVGVTRDWDELKVVVVGRCDNDVIPRWYPMPDGKDQNEVEDPDAVGQTKKKYNPGMFRRCQQQQKELCDRLEKEGVQVLRPPALSADVAQADPVGLSQSWVRECFTVFGTKLVVNQPRTPHRNKDHEALDPFFAKLEESGLCTVHRLPQVSLEKNTDWKNDPRPFLEGGDIFRLGRDVIVTMSYLASSPAGFAWLQALLEPDGIDVWPAYLTEDWEHGDYVFMPVREGLCIAYLKAFTDGLLPSPVTDWDVIALTRDEADQRFAANGVALRENVVLMPAGCPRVVRALERKGVDVIEIPFDGVQYWQGGIDCSTSELWRGEVPEKKPAPGISAPFGYGADGTWHGPTPPSETGWVQTSPGPQGGKRWVRSGGTGGAAPEPTGGGQGGAQPAAPGPKTTEAPPAPKPGQGGEPKPGGQPAPQPQAQSKPTNPGFFSKLFSVFKPAPKVPLDSHAARNEQWQVYQEGYKRGFTQEIKAKLNKLANDLHQAENAESKAEMGAAYQAFSPEQKAAIRDYSDAGYRHCNPQLRTGQTMSERGHNLVKHLDASMIPCAADMTLYRGSSTKEMNRLPQVGETYDDAGFGSTSSNFRIAESYSHDVIFKISVKKGKKMFRMGADDPAHMANDEVLLERGTNYRVKSVTKVGDKNMVELEAM